MMMVVSFLFHFFPLILGSSRAAALRVISRIFLHGILSYKLFSSGFVAEIIVGVSQVCLSVYQRNNSKTHTVLGRIIFADISCTQLYRLTTLFFLQ